jgi:4-amino-4-deoxy-L-arabinose transferase-like glycosyltransferase
MIGTKGVPVLVLAATALPAGPVAALIALGALVAIGGHLAGSRRTVVAGIALLTAGSALMIAGGYLAYRDDPADPRPCPQEATC